MKKKDKKEDSCYFCLWISDFPVVTLTPSIVDASIGTDVNVTCTVQARPSVDDLYWMKNLARM